MDRNIIDPNKPADIFNIKLTGLPSPWAFIDTADPACFTYARPLVESIAMPPGEALIEVAGERWTIDPSKPADIFNIRFVGLPIVLPLLPSWAAALKPSDDAYVYSCDMHAMELSTFAALMGPEACISTELAFGTHESPTLCASPDRCTECGGTGTRPTDGKAWDFVCPDCNHAWRKKDDIPVFPGEMVLSPRMAEYLGPQALTTIRDLKDLEGGEELECFRSPTALSIRAAAFVILIVIFLLVAAFVIGLGVSNL